MERSEPADEMGFEIIRVHDAAGRLERACTMDRMTVVTTFSYKNWKSYASRTVPTWLKHFDPDVDFHFHCDWQPIGDPRITYVRDSAQKVEFIERNSRLNRPFPRPAKGYVTRWETYCHKAFAQCESAFVTQSRFLLFLDADVAVLKRVPGGHLESLLNQKFCGYLPRNHISPETGFILYDLSKDPGRSFFTEFIDSYRTDRLFEFADGWDDAHVFNRCRLSSQLAFENLSGTYADFLDPIGVGPLGEYFDHWIGKESKKLGTSKYRRA